MKLSHQLMAVSLLMLGIPWAGCQYLRELESALRQGQEQALLASTRAIAASFANDTALASLPSANDPLSPLYAEIVDWPLIVDGYDNDWQSLPPRRFTDPQSYPVRMRLRAAIRGSDLYLYFHVFDDSVHYQNRAHPVFENGDRLVLHTGNGERYVLLTGAPGKLPAYKREKQQYRLEQAIEAQWQDNNQGYSIELSIPLNKVQGQLGFTLLDEDDSGTIRARLGNMGSYEQATPPLIYRSRSLHQSLDVFHADGLRLRIINPQQWRVAATGSLGIAESDYGNWFPRWIYRSIVQEPHAAYPPLSPVPGQENQPVVRNALQGKTDIHWYQDPDNEQRSILSVATPIMQQGEIKAVLLAEESNERFLGLTDQAFQRLLLFGFIAFILTGIGLVTYIAWLSGRIRRLSQATAPMIESQELSVEAFPKSRAQDEIGDLTRNFRQLFSRIRHYNDYLQTLSRKLTHELRTPLAVVRTSLDNLEDQEVAESSRVYLQRARDGASRLSQLLTALSEATRMEEAIQQAEQEPLNMAAMLDELVTVYRQLHPEKQIEVSGILPMHLVPSRKTIEAAPELIAQMFDKLFANAVDFTPDGGDIHFHYQEHSRHVLIDVSNEGECLPANIRHQIFDQLISSRDHQHRAKGDATPAPNKPKQGTPSVHLGLGLYIVRLIVEFHQGHIRAENLPDKSGVVFSLNLPLISRKSNEH